MKIIKIFKLNNFNFSKELNILMNEFILRKDDSKNIYDLKPLDNIDCQKESKKFSNLLKLVKLIALSSNNSFYNQQKIFAKKLLYSFLFYNMFFFSVVQIICFIVSYFWPDSNTVRYYMDYAYYNSPKFLLYRFIYFNFPQLFVFVAFRITRIYLKNKSIINKMNLVNEKYQYTFNNIPNNNIFCKEIKKNFDLHFIIKNNKNKNNSFITYKHQLVLLQDKSFYEHLIIYPTESYFPFSNLLSNEEMEFFINIRQSFIHNNLILEKIKVDDIPHKYYIKTINTIFGLFAMKKCSILLLLIKISFYIFDFILDLVLIERNQLIGLKKWEKNINNEILNKGYFLDLNNDIIVIYKIKEEYSSLKYDYQFFCKESQKLMNL